MGTAAGARRSAARRVGVSEHEYLERLGRGEKWCYACSRWLARADFNQDRSRTDGLTAKCRAHQVRTAPGPTRRERSAARARGQAWCRGCAAWLPIAGVSAGACRTHHNEEARRIYRANDGRGRRYRSAARRRGHPRVSDDTREMLFEHTGGLCAYNCGRRATALDHVIPVAWGGRTGPGLMVPACTSCNSSKRDGDPWPWIAKLSDDGLDLVMPGLDFDGAFLDLMDLVAA